MILVTGATGNVGSEVVQQLNTKGVPLRVVARNEAKVSRLDRKIERVIGDFNDQKTLQQALDGVNSLFMFPIIFEHNHASNKLLVDCAKKAGVQHIVMLSSLGAAEPEIELGILHRQKEEIVEQSGIARTFVRPGYFMTNTLQWLPMIAQFGKVFNATGAGKVAAISPRDIAAVAVTALTNDGHKNKIYHLTGAELISVPEQVEILSQVTGKEIECLDIPVAKLAEEVRKSGAPDFLVNSLSKMWERVKEGKGSVQTDEVKKITGREPENFQQWAEAHRDLFLKPAGAGAR